MNFQPIPLFSIYKTYKQTKVGVPILIISKISINCAPRFYEKTVCRAQNYQPFTSVPWSNSVYESYVQYVIVELKSGESLSEDPAGSGANVSKTSDQVHRSYTVIHRGNGETVLTNKGMFLTRYSEKEET